MHPDPDNPKKLKNYQTSIRTTDEKPVLCRLWRYNDMEKAFMKAKARIGRWEQKVEPAEPGAWASALVLIPYRDRIEMFKEKWGEHAREAIMWERAGGSHVLQTDHRLQRCQCEDTTRCIPVTEDR